MQTNIYVSLKLINYEIPKKTSLVLLALIAGSGCKQTDTGIDSDFQSKNRSINPDKYVYDELCGNKIASIYMKRFGQDKDLRGKPKTSKLQGDSIQVYDTLRRFQKLYIKDKVSLFPESLKYGEDIIKWADKNPTKLLSYFSFEKIDRLGEPNGLRPLVGTILAWYRMDCTGCTFSPILPKGDI